jgi:hypothetical protein
MWILNHRPSGPRAIAALIAGCWLLAGVSLSDDILPKGFEVSRYQQLWERNPFTLVTPSLAQGPASPFSKLILVNWLHEGGAKGKDILFVQDTETNEIKKVTKEAGANSDELRLLEMVPNQNPSLIVAKLTNGREEGVVKFRFDLQQNAQVTAANLQGQRFLPGQVPGPNNQFGNNVPVPGRRMPQMPPTAMQGQNVQQANPANAPDAQEIRRRRMLPTPAQNQVPVQQNAVQPQAQQNNAQQNNNAGAESDDDE